MDELLDGVRRGDSMPEAPSGPLDVAPTALRPRDAGIVVGGTTIRPQARDLDSGLGRLAMPLGLRRDPVRGRGSATRPARRHHPLSRPPRMDRSDPRRHSSRASPPGSSAARSRRAKCPPYLGLPHEDAVRQCDSAEDADVLEGARLAAAGEVLPKIDPHVRG